MSLRAHPAEQTATLPDGRVVAVRVGIADDSYIPKRELDTVVLELAADGEHLAAVTTVLDAGDEREARALLREVVAGLESGDLEPTAAAIEPLAERIAAT
jgi:hypothetical protein